MKIMVIAAVLLAKCVYDWFAYRTWQDTWRMNAENAAIRDKINKRRIAEISEQITNVGERVTLIERRMDKDYVTSDRVADAHVVDAEFEALRNRVGVIEREYGDGDAHGRAIADIYTSNNRFEELSARIDSLSSAINQLWARTFADDKVAG